MGALNSPPCGRALLNFMYGSIRTRLSGVILLPRSALTSISRSFGARFQFSATPQKFPHGCLIFTLIRTSCDVLMLTLIGAGMPTFLLVPLHAGETLLRSTNG